ncbi:Amino acid adenylation [Xenorhabdus beddingii]|uniref:Amino acid adenylation n=1 Tax=Xenorhabdus beddingii TaxID=40578 RepID=A0A1Y2STS2_9GAMM|nr:amino acid adenylation domain-containing protein [Xenorhabdus beddingii]OTA21792.1 Amino acid adenylation [Xenorhabdus beddingii]
MPKYVEQLGAIPDVLFEVVTKYSNKTALIFNSETLSYRDLWEQSEKIASVLQKIGIKKSDKVAVKLTRSLELYLVMLAVIRMGAVLVPIGNNNPEQYVNECISVANASLLITNGDNGDNVKSPVRCSAITIEDLLLKAETLDYVPIAFETLAATEPVMMLMTSGSTGQPKCVIIRHCGLTRLAIPVEQLGNTDNDRYLQLADPSFAASANEIWMSLLTGATLVVYPQDMPDLATLDNIITHQRISILFLSGGLFRLFVEVCPETLHKPHSVIVSGDFVSADLFLTAARAGNGRIFNGMGCTENSAISSIYHVSPTTVFDNASPVPIGFPLPLIKMVVLDDDFKICAPDVPGELCIGGVGLAEGYSDPELTHNRFVWLHLNGCHQRYYRTDDRAKSDEFGKITLLGRGSHIGKIRGFRVEITGIEHVLRAHPQIDDVIIIVEQTANEPRLHACYLSKSTSLHDTELREFLNAQLPSYMVPERFTHCHSLPMTKNGKRDRIQLVQLITHGNA